MKNFLIRPIIILALITKFLFSQWSIQNYDTTYSLFDIKFLNENTGFACGERYYPSLQIHKSVIYKTTNSGGNWVTVFADSNLYIHTIGILDNNTILAGGGIYFVSQPKLLKSTNAGNNWFNVDHGEITAKINSFSIFGNIIYATCINGIYKSNNNGINWAISTTGFGEFTNAFFINENTGWYGYDDGYIKKTTNAGLNWVQIYFNNSFTYAHNMYFTNLNTGYMIYDSSQTLTSKIIKTTNGGINWFNLNPGLINHHWAIDFVDENTGYISGDGGNVIKTTNAGQSWNISWTGLNFNLLDIKFIDAYTGFACGGSSVIIKTTSGGFIGVNPVSTEIPKEHSLYQNYPNPFNPVTNIKFSIPKSAFVKLAVYDMLGREVENLVSQQLTPGTYQIDWNAAKFSSGIYIYRLSTDDFSLVKKMSLIK